MRRSIRVAHVITALEVGGAEMMLFRLLARQNRQRFSSEVFSLTTAGSVAARIESLEIPVTAFALGTPLGMPQGLGRLCAAVSKFRPDIIQTWLYHADLAGLLLQRTFHRSAKLCWNIRCAGLKVGDVSRSTLFLRRMLSRLSSIPHAVIANSSAGVQAHERIGYHPRRWALLYNGFDTDGLRPDGAARAALRRELGIAPDTPLIGMVARLDPMKDHPNFLAAAARVIAAKPRVRFLLAGRGMETRNSKIVEAIAAQRLTDHVLLLGERHDIPRVMTALDVLVSASYGEGLPNVVGEAMSCGVPCVATNVGDTPYLIDDSGVLVPPRDADALAKAILAILALPSEKRLEMGRRARTRVVAQFSLEAAVRGYSELYEELAGE